MVLNQGKQIRATVAVADAKPSRRNLVVLAIGFSCMIGFCRMCSLGYAGYLTYELTSSTEAWYAARTIVDVATLVLLALAGRNGWFKLGLNTIVLATVCAIASSMLFAVDSSGSLGLVVAMLGGFAMAVYTYLWMLLLSANSIRTIVCVALPGLVLAGAIVEGAPLVGTEVGLVIVVFAAFAAGSAAVLFDPDLKSCAADGPLDEGARARTPWLTVVMVLACEFFVSVLYAVAQSMTWLYDWKPNYVVFGAAAILVIVASALVMLRSKAWMHIIWVPLFSLFVCALLFSCLPAREMIQVAVGLMMAAVFVSHFLYWIIFPSLFSVLKVPRAFAAGIVLVLANSSLATLIGEALASVLPRSMQNLSSVAGVMAIVVAVLFAITFVLNRNRLGVVGVWSQEVSGSPAVMASVSNGGGDEFGRTAEDEQGVVNEATQDVASEAEPAELEDEPNPADALRARLDGLVEQYGLTPRESEVALYTVQGFSCAYIAEKLVVSNSTIRFHQQNIYRKFEVHSRNELIELVTAE